MSTLFIAGAIAITLLLVAWYVLYQSITFDLGDLSFTETEIEQLNQDFKGGLRNVRRNN
jgi:hypothetical protein|tara:strand:+ start:295 stop:471 length:177 start_codon:yes stop_codon:yes gene_type:complete